MSVWQRNFYNTLLPDFDEEEIRKSISFLKLCFREFVSYLYINVMLDPPHLNAVVITKKLVFRAFKYQAHLHQR